MHALGGSAVAVAAAAGSVHHRTWLAAAQQVGPVLSAVPSSRRSSLAGLEQLPSEGSLLLQLQLSVPLGWPQLGRPLSRQRSLARERSLVSGARPGGLARTRSAGIAAAASAAAAPPSGGRGCASLAPLAAPGAGVADEPIIVAASWLGAGKRPFAKYKQLWQSLGYHRILAARPPMTSIMLPAAGQLLAANFTRKLLAKAAAHPRAPILVHLFSGGGFIFMAWVFQLLVELRSEEADAVRARIRGVILDSSPADLTADVSSRALVAAALGRPADGIEAALPWLVRPTAAVVDGYLRLPFVRGALLGMQQAWLTQAPACPKLFLYSDADALIEPAVVEAFMAAQAASGSTCTAYKWHDSGHVDHYRKYPEEYRQQLAAFVADVLGKPQAPPPAAAATAAATAAGGEDVAA